MVRLHSTIGYLTVPGCSENLSSDFVDKFGRGVSQEIANSPALTKISPAV